MSELTLRVATANDVEPLLVLITEFKELDGYRDRDDHHEREGLLPLIADPNLGYVVVAERDGELVSYAVLTWGWGLESGGREALLDEFYVRPRGEGIGSRMFETCVLLAREAGAKVLFLETEAVNDRARTFYKRHGMQVEESIWMISKL